MEPLRKKHEMRNYDFCYGMGVNYVDMDNSKMYHIQEYREAIDRGEKPDKIRVTLFGGSDETIEWIDPYILQEKMKDPDPDPRY